MILIPVQDCKDDSGKPGKRWGEVGKCFTHDGSDEGIKVAIKKATAQGLAIGEGKLENGAPSLEYLAAFHRFVKSHTGIYDQIKAEVHKRARGSAGGQAKAKKALENDEIDLEDMIDHLPDEKTTNEAFVEGEIIETDEYFDVPTVFTREGVWTGTNGIPTLKTFEALKASAPWFVGAPITPNHIDTDTIRPDDRRLGHVISAIAREDKRDIFGISRYYKSLLSDEEQTKLKNRQNIDGSPGYFTPTKREEGDFGGKKYQAIETGPYVVTEYATFFDGTRGACSSDDNCGPFQNAKAKEKPIDRLVLDENGNVKKCPIKRKNEANKMAEEIDALKEELSKQLNAAKEMITKLEGTISEQATKIEELSANHKALNEAFAGKVKAESEAKIASQKDAFKKTLNAAASTEIDTLWEEVKGLNPVEYETWKQTNSTKLLTEAEKKAATGKKITNAGGDIVEAAKSRANDTLFKRR